MLLEVELGWTTVYTVLYTGTSNRFERSWDNYWERKKKKLSSDLFLAFGLFHSPLLYGKLMDHINSNFSKIICTLAHNSPHQLRVYKPTVRKQQAFTPEKNSWELRVSFMVRLNSKFIMAAPLTHLPLVQRTTRATEISVSVTDVILIQNITWIRKRGCKSIVRQHKSKK